MATKPEFETSVELKRLFMRELDSWRKRTRLGLGELSQHCGVSPSYLAHVGRYGRIPSKPVLLLLALNFGMSRPQEILSAARVQEPWPFDSPLGLAPLEDPSQGLLTVNLNMKGLVDAIVGALRSEHSPKSLLELLAGRPLRLGLNPLQHWLFAVPGDHSRGLLPDLCAALGSTLQCNVETQLTQFDRYVEQLCCGEIDIFGPLLARPKCPAKILFTIATHKMGISVLRRLRVIPNLPVLDPPRHLDDLISRPYEIAVFKDSRAHLFALTALKRAESSVIVCSSEEEAVERLLLKGISRPAHLFLTSAMFAARAALEHPESVEALFVEQGTALEMADNSFAVRPDWGSVVSELNDGIRRAMEASNFSGRLQLLIDAGLQGRLEALSAPCAR